MDRYSRAKIYRIVGGSGKTYYGSTCVSLSRRLSKHKAVYKQWLEGKTHYISSFEILAEEEYDIVLVEEFPCDNKEQLHMRERYWIESNDCVNIVVPGRTDKEYYETHKDKVAKRQKQYRDLNKDKVAKRVKQYYETHKDKVAKPVKQYKKTHKDKIAAQLSQKIQCECGAIVCKGWIARHKHTQRHILATTEAAAE